jgi:chemotaxis protein MotA
MDFAHLFEPLPAAIVVGGTLVSTALRTGRSDCLHASGTGRPFAPPPRRGPFAWRSCPLAHDVRQDGVYRARAHPTGDREFDEAIDAMIEARTASVLMMRHAVQRKRRLARAQLASATLSLAADLAPVFGLAGTLVSLSQLSGRGIARSMFMGAISISVMATLYGLLLANILLAPLARAVERRAEREEESRQDVVDWLASHSPRWRRVLRDHRIAELA